MILKGLLILSCILQHVIAYASSSVIQGGEDKNYTLIALLSSFSFTSFSAAINTSGSPSTSFPQIISLPIQSSIDSIILSRGIPKTFINQILNGIYGEGACIIIISCQMFNPFDEESSCEPSVDEFDSSLPICFDDTLRGRCEGGQSTPIAIVDLDRLSEKVSNPDIGEVQLRGSLQQAQQMLQELKGYNQSLEQRNLEMVLELQKQRMKNAQLLGALTFIRNSEQERNQVLEAKIGENNEYASRHLLERNRVEILENEAKSLRLQNGYLKELILIANENYEKLEERNKELLDRCTTLEEERNRREMEMLKKTEEIKSMFATIVVEKHTPTPPAAVRKEEMGNTNTSINFNSLKSVRKEPVEDAYRQIFMKTLKPRRDNKENRA